MIDTKNRCLLLLCEASTCSMWQHATLNQVYFLEVGKKWKIVKRVQ
jgi:hypothetical protein